MFWRLNRSRVAYSQVGDWCKWTTGVWINMLWGRLEMEQSTAKCRPSQNQRVYLFYQAQPDAGGGTGPAFCCSWPSTEFCCWSLERLNFLLYIYIYIIPIYIYESALSWIRSLVCLEECCLIRLAMALPAYSLSHHLLPENLSLEMPGIERRTFNMLSLCPITELWRFREYPSPGKVHETFFVHV